MDLFRIICFCDEQIMGISIKNRRLSGFGLGIWQVHLLPGAFFWNGYGLYVRIYRHAAHGQSDRQNNHASCSRSRELCFQQSLYLQEGRDHRRRENEFFATIGIYFEDSCIVCYS